MPKELMPDEVKLLQDLDRLFRNEPHLGLHSRHTGPLSERLKTAVVELGTARGMQVTFPIIKTPNGDSQHTIQAIRMKAP